MRQVALPTSGRQTSQLGFGCAFWPSVTEQDAARLLDAAYDAGIRHFDVAPFYLDGAAEAYLGAFLKRRSDATVTTKYGLLPPSARPFHIQVARAVLGPAVRAARKAIRRGGGGPDSGGITAKASFAPEDARKSLGRSLSLLNRDHVDIFLMHEADPKDLDREGLLETLRMEVSRGRIGAFGVGGDIERVKQVHMARPEYCEVAQFNWDAVSHAPRFGDAFEIFFWVLSRDLRGLHRKFQEDAALARRWSEEVGLDLADIRNLSAVMLKAALVTNPNGVTLVHSNSAEHIVQNAEAAENGALEKPALAFKRLAAQEKLR